MLSIYQWENGGLKESAEFSPSCWINLVEPETNELERVLSYSQVPRDFLTQANVLVLTTKTMHRFSSFTCRVMRMRARLCSIARLHWALS